MHTKEKNMIFIEYISDIPAGVILLIPKHGDEIKINTSSLEKWLRQTGRFCWFNETFIQEFNDVKQCDNEYESLEEYLTCNTQKTILQDLEKYYTQCHPQPA